MPSKQSGARYNTRPVFVARCAKVVDVMINRCLSATLFAALLSVAACSSEAPQAGGGGEYRYSIIFDGDEVYSEVNRSARQFYNVKVYISGPFYPAAFGYISKLELTNFL